MVGCRRFRLERRVFRAANSAARCPYDRYCLMTARAHTRRHVHTRGGTVADKRERARTHGGRGADEREREPNIDIDIGTLGGKSMQLRANRERKRDTVLLDRILEIELFLEK